MSHGRTLSSIAILSSLRDYSLQLHAEDIRVTQKKNQTWFERAFNITLTHKYIYIYIYILPPYFLQIYSHCYLAI